MFGGDSDDPGKFGDNVTITSGGGALGTVGSVGGGIADNFLPGSGGIIGALTGGSSRGNAVPVWIVGSDIGGGRGGGILDSIFDIGKSLFGGGGGFGGAASDFGSAIGSLFNGGGAGGVLAAIGAGPGSAFSSAAIANGSAIGGLFAGGGGGGILAGLGITGGVGTAGGIGAAQGGAIGGLFAGGGGGGVLGGIASGTVSTGAAGGATAAGGTAGGGGLMSSLIPFFTNPVTAIVGGAIAAIIIGYRMFTQGPIEAGNKEALRDFGIEVGEKTLEQFVAGVGLSKDQFKPIRKDVNSSPECLKQVLLPAAQKQGD